MSTLDLSQLTAADMSNPALTAQDLADITAARADLHPYVATHPSLYPALAQWLANRGVVPAHPPVAQPAPVAAPAQPVEPYTQAAAPVDQPAAQAAPVAQETPAVEPEPVVEAVAPVVEEAQPVVEEPAAVVEPAVEADPVQSDAWGAPQTEPVQSDAWGAPQTEPVQSDAWGAPQTEPVQSDAWGAPQVEAVAPVVEPEPIVEPEPVVEPAPVADEPQQIVEDAQPFVGEAQVAPLMEAPVASAPSISDEELERTIIDGTRERSMAEIVAEENAAAQAAAYGQNPAQATGLRAASRARRRVSSLRLPPSSSAQPRTRRSTSSRVRSSPRLAR